MLSRADAYNRLRKIPAFVEFAREKMATDADFLRREADAGDDITQIAAKAIVEIGSVQT